jgi:hypothetical protein
VNNPPVLCLHCGRRPEAGEIHSPGGCTQTGVEHAPEPWHLGTGAYEQFGMIRTEGRLPVACTGMADPEDAIPNARRIVAAINATAGLSTADLEAMPLGALERLVEMARTAAPLTAERILRDEGGQS